MITKTRNSGYLLHFILWLAYVSFCYLVHRIQEYYIPFYAFASKYLVSISVFYITSISVLRFRRKSAPLILIVLVTFLFDLCLRTLISNTIYPWSLNQKPHFKGFLQYFSGSLWWWFQYSIFGLAYAISRILVEKEKNLRISEKKNFDLLIEKQSQEQANLILEQANHRLEQEKLILHQQKIQTECAFLRSQINPHFLLNTLNFFYARSMAAKDEDLTNGIMTLANIMRYSLQTNAKEGDDMVLIRDEMRHLDNVIAINEMRFSKKVIVAYDLKGDTDGLVMPPLILLTLVENCVKHGELFDPQHPLKISLEMDEEEDRLIFSTFNKTKTGPKEEGHAIGIANTQQRLHSAYGEDYSLTLTPEGDCFRAILIIHNFFQHNENYRARQHQQEPWPDAYYELEDEDEEEEEEEQGETPNE
jgi:two-component system, LytTR family, sensor kinase